MKHSVCQRMTFGILAFLMASLAGAQPDNSELRTQFVEAYGRYEAAVSGSDLEGAAAASNEALELGVQLFGEVHPNTANLRQNRALMLELQGRVDEAKAEYSAALEILEGLDGAESLSAVAILLRLAGISPSGEIQTAYLRRALEIQRAAAPEDVPSFARIAIEAANILSAAIGGREAAIAGREAAGDILRPVLEELEMLYGRDAPELISVLVALGKAEARPQDDGQHLKRAARAMEIVDAAFPDDPVVRGDVALELGNNLLFLSQSPDSDTFLNYAFSNYEEALGPDDPRTAEAAVMLGEARFAKRDFSRAEPPLLTALAFVAGKPESRLRELRIRTLLSEIYVNEGKSDEASLQQQEIARLTDSPDPSNTQEYLPIVKVPPVYPMRAAQRGLEGYAVVEYTVTKTGETRGPRIIESSNPLFDRAALESVRGYRYQPRIVDGEPVDVDGVRTLIRFDLD